MTRSANAETTLRQRNEPAVGADGPFDARVRIRRPVDTWVLPFLLLLTAASLIPIWTTPIPPLQDLPNHLLKVDIIWKYLRHDPQVQAVYTLNLRLLSNYTCYVAIFLLAPLIGLLAAAKAFISVYLVALPCCAYAWLRRSNPRNTVLSLAVLAISYNMFLSKGNLNFCLALPLYVGALAIFDGPETRTGHPALAFGLVATLLYFTHGLVFLALTGVIVCALALDRRKEPLRRSMGLIPGLLCFAAMIIPESLSPSSAQGLVPEFERPGRYLIRDGFHWLFTPYGWDYDTYFALAWVGVIAILGIYTSGRIIREACEGRPLVRNLRENKWLVAAVALCFVYAFAPVKLTDWGHLRARFIPLATLTAIGALQAPRASAIRVGAAIVFAVSALVIQSKQAEEYWQGSKRVQEYISGIGAIDAGGSLLAIDKDQSEEDVRVNLHSWAYYHLAKGGWGPYLHAYPSYHPVVYKHVPWAPGEDLRSIEIPTAVLERAAACYDYLLVWTPDAVDEARAYTYFDPLFRTPSLEIWRNRAGVRGSVPAAIPACRAAPQDDDGGSDGRVG